MTARPTDDVRGDAASLIAAGLDHLAGLWGARPVVEDVVVDHPSRAVVRATAPDGRSVYVKLEVGRRRAQREAAGIEAAGSTGFPVPDLLHVELGDDLSVLVLASVIGRPLRGDDEPRAWAVAAHHLAELHRIEPPTGTERFDHREGDWTGFMQWWTAHEVAQVIEAGMLDPATADALHTRAQAVLCDMPAPRRSLLHGDCQPAHVLFDQADRVTAFIDWGDASSGDPLLDLAVLTCHHPDRWPTVRHAYGLDPGADDVVWAYWVVRLLGSATWMSDHGFDPGPDLRAAERLL